MTTIWLPNSTFRDISPEGALDEIFRYAASSTLLVNKVCTHCLIYGVQKKQRIIDDLMAKRLPANSPRLLPTGRIGQRS